jgi:hypothetical protein
MTQNSSFMFFYAKLKNGRKTRFFPGFLSYFLGLFRAVVNCMAPDLRFQSFYEIPTAADSVLLCMFGTGVGHKDPGNNRLISKPMRRVERY